ncbi:hypothetical protein [Bdellovibrio sp. KM01]|uniref:hypothetical protein n=1 Tax=Bdellovibrio sp. KM01 TaxID=2748865 RepID=UPI0015EA0949|nr:hypothetical protein [Bdellovibrio sp. KM01]QLY26304.1 hypothetical protein HW988_04545 [Bdellovibrio sp. KM01]
MVNFEIRRAAHGDEPHIAKVHKPETLGLCGRGVEAPSSALSCSFFHATTIVTLTSN